MSLSPPTIDLDQLMCPYFKQPFEVFDLCVISVSKLFNVCLREDIVRVK